MKRKILSILLVACMALSALVGLTSCDDEPTPPPTPAPSPTPTPSPTTPEKLSAPVITLTGNVASWDADSNAEKFEISLDGNLSYVENSVRSKTLTDGQTLKLRAIGDGSAYSTSDWSNSVTYTAGTPAPQPVKLGAPQVTISSTGLASWAAVANASGYVYKINGGAEVPTTETSVQLTNGQSIVVKAVGDGSSYTDSDYSATQTYTAGNPSPQPVKLGVPQVTISSTGLASWTAVANASGYVYKINGGTEIPTTATSVQLTNGQSIVVKAVGDGSAYTDGNYSTSKTYTAGAPSTTAAPTYLGIFASNNEPSQANGLPDAIAPRPMMMSYRMMRSGGWRQFGTALDEYFSDSNNHLGANAPTESDYEIYSRAGRTVYIQIWLNNSSQHTILSLKLNGTKYQVGGGLSSFFIEDGGEHYNCVYVAVTIPSGTYTEKTYTVTDIEYIADTYINADGTDEFMNNNDTVSIGLPYNAENPTVSDFESSDVTFNSCSATFKITDASGLTELSDGWLGVAVYDGYNIVANQKATIGNNTLNATGLVDNTDYQIIVYLYADLHDGYGVCAHTLSEQYIHTSEAITFDDVSGVMLYDSENDGYYGAIKVNTTLNSATAEYIKLEILKNDEVVYTDTSFNGSATVSDGILCGNSYIVRVYYKDTEYPDGKYIEEYTWTEDLRAPWYHESGSYTFVNDAIYYFQIGDNDGYYAAIDSFTLKLYNEYSARWVASDVLYLLDNPTAIDNLQAQIDALYDDFNAAYGNDDLMWSINQQIGALNNEKGRLENAKWYLEYHAGNNTDKAYWQAEADKGKYFYTFEYNGTDTEKLFKVGKYYYVVLEDALNFRCDEFNVQIDLRYDLRDENGPTEEVINTYLYPDNLFICNGTEVRDVSFDGDKLTFSLVNIDDYMNENGGESTYNKGYVYKIYMHHPYYGNKVFYINDQIPTLNVDETAWLEEYIRRIKAGESTDGLYEIYVPKYEDSYTVTLDLSEIGAGLYDIYICTRMMAKEYMDGEYDRGYRAQIGVYKQIEKPSIKFDEWYGEVTPEEIYEWDGSYVYEAVDKNGEPVEINAEYDYGGNNKFKLVPAGTKIRVKLSTSGYWLESEWSEWYTFEGKRIDTPKFGEYALDACVISCYTHTSDAYISHYVYTINGGEEIMGPSMSPELNNGDVLRVKAVPSEQGIANGYIESEWATYTCTDSRTPLATPSNIRIEWGHLVWDSVDSALHYYVYETYNGKTQLIGASGTSCGAKENAVYRIRAIPQDRENYRWSAYSEEVTYTSNQT